MAKPRNQSPHSPMGSPFLHRTDNGALTNVNRIQQFEGLHNVATPKYLRKAFHASGVQRRLLRAGPHIRRSPLPHAFQTGQTILPQVGLTGTTPWQTHESEDLPPFPPRWARYLPYYPSTRSEVEHRYASTPLAASVNIFCAVTKLTLLGLHVRWERYAASTWSTISTPYFPSIGQGIPHSHMQGNRRFHDDALPFQRGIL